MPGTDVPGTAARCGPGERTSLYERLAAAALRVDLAHPPGRRCSEVSRYALLAILPLLAGSPGVGDDLIDYAGRSNDIPLRRRARALKARD